MVQGMKDIVAAFFVSQQLHGPQCLDAVIPLGGNLAFAEQIMFETSLFHLL